MIFYFMVNKAVKPLAIIAIIYGILLVLGSVLIFGFGLGSLKVLKDVADIPGLAEVLTEAVVSIVSLVMAGIGILWFLGGLGILYFREWGRVLLIIASIISLLIFPIGTTLGIIYLVYMFKKDVKKDFD